MPKELTKQTSLGLALPPRRGAEEQAGIFWNAYAKIEQGKQEPKLETLQKILKVLGVKSSDILPF